jgi:hypothetical protein
MEPALATPYLWLKLFPFPVQVMFVWYYTNYYICSTIHPSGAVFIIQVLLTIWVCLL